MIRYVLSVLLAVALVGASIGPIENAIAARSEKEVANQLRYLEAEAQSLLNEEGLTPRSAENPKRHLKVSFPGTSRLSKPPASVTITGCVDTSLATYRIKGRSQKRIRLDVPIRDINGGPVTFHGAESVRATLRLGRGANDNKIVYFNRHGKRPRASVANEGVWYTYYNDNSIDSLRDLTSAYAVKSGRIGHFYIPPTTDDENFGLRYTGYLQVPEDGTYRFYLKSDDGSRIYVDGKRVVDNSGVHSPLRKSGQIRLDEGTHSIQVLYFNAKGGAELEVEYAGPCIPRSEIPIGVLSH